MSLETLFEIVRLRPGVNSLRSVDHGETFHPGIGPVEEARILHVEQMGLAERCREPGKFILWDVGLGAAANAISAIEALAGAGADVEIHSFDRSTDPLQYTLNHAADFSYIQPHQEAIATLVGQGEVQINPRLRWFFHRGDFREVLEQPELPAPQGIFYDPYSPAKNRDMWTLEHFERLQKRLSTADCLLTSYSRSTAVRVTFLLAGFFVGAGRKIGDKAETTVVANRLECLENPLPAKFLERVRKSDNAAPMRSLAYSLEKIAADDLAALERHPQFNLIPIYVE